MKHLLTMQESRFQAGPWIAWFVAFAVCWLHGCASTNNIATQSPASIGFDRSQAVLPTKDLARHQQPFEGRLPLGIGARFDFLVADTASGMADFYDSYIQPLRKGKLFDRQPYQLDYSILPKKGEAFVAKKGSLLDSLSIKSDYKLQIGISRNFVSFTDFFNPSFWLATGRYSTSVPGIPSSGASDDPSMYRNDAADWEIDLNQPIDFDLDAYLDERWGLSPDED